MLHIIYKVIIEEEELWQGTRRKLEMDSIYNLRGSSPFL